MSAARLVAATKAACVSIPEASRDPQHVAICNLQPQTIGSLVGPVQTIGQLQRCFEVRDRLGVGTAPQGELTGFTPPFHSRHS